MEIRTRPNLGAIERGSLTKNPWNYLKKIITILQIIFLGYIKSKPNRKQSQTIKMNKNIVPCTGFEPWSPHSAKYYVLELSCWQWATEAEWIMPFEFSCLSATERRSTGAKRDDLHCKWLFLVKNKGQWNAKSGPKAAYGNCAIRTKFSRRLETK